MVNKFVVIDLETTGNNPKKGDKIIQFAAVVIENGMITERFSSLLNPIRSIPPFIEELTGLSDEMVESSPLFEDIAPKVNSMLESAYFVAHNVLFDLSFLQEELIQAGYDGFYGSVLDTVEMARILFPTADGYKLTDLAAMMNLNHDRPHQADSDAEVTAELLLILLKKLSSLPNITTNQLFQLSGGLKSDLQQLMDELIAQRKNVTESQLDSIKIFNGLALKNKDHQVLYNEIIQEQVIYPIGDQEKTNLLKQGFKVFQKRTGQFTMMDSIYQAFVDNCHTLIEAGTGVGKSLGYLLPIAYFAKKNQLPIVVSTHTIQLQEQIISKEIPLLEKMIPFHLRYVLLKGRNHYLCLEKFSRSLTEENDNYDTTLTKMQILVWLTETVTGDRDELNLSSGGSIFWNKIKSEPSLFVKSGLWKEEDFYIRAKAAATDADIIITNHSLLLSSVFAEVSILPEFDYVIIDEAHHFEKVASRYIGHSIDYLTTRLLISQFGHYEQKLLFYHLEELVSAQHLDKSNLIRVNEISKLIMDLTYEIDEFFKLTAIYAKLKQSGKKGYRTKVRFSKDDNVKEKTALINSAERFAFLLKDLHQEIGKRLSLIEQNVESLSSNQKSKLEEISSFVHDLNELRNSIVNCFMNDTPFVNWIEIDFRSQQNVTTFYAQPAFVSSALKDRFFDRKKSVVLTSATLTINNSFEYMMNEIGINQESTRKLTIPSPFEYKNQVQLLIPEDLPEINAVSNEEYVISITEHIITIAEATKGRMLILFTAHDMLKKTYELIKESGFLNDYAMIAQGITSGSRTRLTRNFQRYEKAILLGTSSFWEGVDIPGEDLSCLVIVRLPFSPPDEPLTEAKCQLISQQGGNPFTEYSLPEAILRFKQGFGRLIRTETDRGIMVVFDKRVVTTKYGKAFLQSIPDVPVNKGKMDDLVDIIYKWL
ncbi:ATP-dependent DNA helicase DinG [Bacillus sp. MRMR6]|uniref:ATP-dependent DNA helicase DinG n=1 Tax=Bacillus sp. MRMR6 TaxID=1928617 RepID=UPI0009524647|nr:ATP-dependent DNA helicase DinG [Bacillus sp. MRMR6]OLS40263.1 ATP-dependent helicase DinG [Bacillus sp. MRMR6]